jgi:two-component system sensor histidine kinase MtrB
MASLVTAGRLRWRLTVTFALVAAVSTGALALGTYLVVRESRLADSVDSSVAQARANLVLAGAILDGGSAREDAEALLAFYARRSDFETVALTSGGRLGSSGALAETPIPGGVRALVRKGDLAFQRLRTAEARHLVVGGRAPGSQAELYFFFSEQALYDDLAQLGTILLVGWAIVVVLAGAAGALVARRLLHPVRQASDAAHALAEGLLETRLPVETDDEFGAWAAAFNEMADALQERIRALAAAQARERRFTADVAHELRTPVTALVGEAALLREHLEGVSAGARRPAELLVEDVGRMHRLVEELMEISRLDSGREDVRVEPVDLRALATAVERSRGLDAAAEHPAETVIVRTDPRRVERVLANLIDNACVHGGEHVTVRVGKNGAKAFVDVCDRGPGMAPEHLPHVFERFYKVDPARSGAGSGLGLAIAWENARLLGGEIVVSSEVGAGSRFTFTLPVANPLPGGEEGETRTSDADAR